MHEEHIRIPYADQENHLRTLTRKVGSVRHNLFAGAGALAGVRRPSPVPTDRRVKHDVVVIHLLGDVAAIAARERRGGLAPRARVRVSVLDVLGDRRARKPPDGNSVAGPQMHERAASLVVERVAERRGVSLQVRAARVRVGRALARRVDKAGGRIDIAGRAGAAGVQGDLVIDREVHVLCIYICEPIYPLS